MLSDLLDVFLFCIPVSSMLAKRFLALVDNLVSFQIHYSFRIMVVVSIYPHCAMNPFLRFMKETITAFLLKKRFPDICVTRLEAKRTFQFNGTSCMYLVEP